MLEVGDDLGLEVPGEPRPGLGPRYLRDHDSAPRAVHARHGGDQFDAPAAEILATPTARAAALVVTVPAFAASGASEHARTWAHADLEHGFGTQWGVGDARVLDHRAFDVEKLVEYAAHQALFGCVFLGR